METFDAHLSAETILISKPLAVRIKEWWILGLGNYQKMNIFLPKKILRYDFRHHQC